MIKSLSRSAALVATGSAIALAVSALPAQASPPPGWRVSTTVATRGWETLMTGVAAVSAKDAWSMGVALKKATLTSVIRHWNGKSWGKVTLPAKVAKAWNKQSPVDSLITASAGTNVWAFDELFSRTYLRDTAKGWRIGTLPGSSANMVGITSADALSANDVWAFGVQENLNTGVVSPYIVRFNGTKWVGVSAPNDGGIVAAGASSAGSLWALAETEPGGAPPPSAGAARRSAEVAVARVDFARRPFGTAATSSGTFTVLHWGPLGGWKAAAVQPVLPAGGTFTSLLAGTNNTVWLGGAVRNSKKGTTEEVADWNGKAKVWSTATLPAASSSYQFSVVELASDGRGGMWAEGGNEGSAGPAARLWHLSGHKWSSVKPSFGKGQWELFQMATSPRSDSVWGAGAVQVGKATDGLIAIYGATPR
jgi:hypothetical protein